MIQRAGDRPAFIQAGMELVNDDGERWKVKSMWKGLGEPMTAVLVPPEEPPSLSVPCSELRNRWELAADFDDGDD